MIHVKRQWLFNAAEKVCVFALVSLCAVPSGHALPLSPNYSSTYGSGSFGTWTVDSNGLPAYNYVNGSAADSQSFIAQPPYHMLGNSGTLLHAYNNGQKVLFTSRTFPRYANYFDPSRQAWSGGFGWVFDRTANQTWSTYYPDKPAAATYSTTWGMGYARKQAAYNNVSVDEYTFSPLGDNEVVMQQITLKNTASSSKTISYYSYWDWDSLVMQSPVAPPFMQPYHENEDYWLSYDAARNSLKAAIQWGGDSLTTPNDLIDPSAKTAFFTMLNGIDGYETVKANVFTAGQNHPWPDALNKTALSNSKSVLFGYNSRDMLFVTERKVTLAAGASTTLYTLYGLARTGQENAVIDTYFGTASKYQNRLTDVINDFKTKTVKFTVPAPADNWLSREVAWDSYYMNAGVTQEDFFSPTGDAHTLNQSSAYLLDAGQNIGVRDMAQHLVPFVWSNPQMAKQTLRYVLRTLYTDGSFHFGTAGYGEDAAFSIYGGYQSSDHNLWVMWAIAEYLNATRDYAFLDEVNKYNRSTQTATVYQMLKVLTNHQLNAVGIGSHGLARILNADWADDLTKNSGNASATAQNGESTANTALAIWVYPMVKDIATRKSDSTFANTLNSATAGLRTAMAAQWRTNMFNRAYLVNANNVTYELGADLFRAESNAFALLAENKLLTATQINSLVTKMLDASTGAITSVGLNYTGKAPAGYTPPNAVGSVDIGAGDTNWYSLSGALVRGLANYADISSTAKTLAWNEFKKNTLGNHSQLYPDQFYGLISGSDCVYTAWNALTVPPGNTAHTPGHCWLENIVRESFGYDAPSHPINNMHSHSHLVLNALKLVGVRANNAGYVIAPSMPTDDGFGWESSAFGVQYEPLLVSGKINAAATATVAMQVKLTDELTALSTIFVKRNGSNIAFTKSGGTVSFNLALTANTAVNWTISN